MSIDQIRASGLLELYVIGDLTEAEQTLVENAIAEEPSLKQELLEIERALESYALLNAKPVDPTLKPMLLATVDYTERLQNGEVPSTPPSLHAGSKIADFSQWLDRPDMQEPEEYESMHGKIIGSDEVKTTLIIWLKEGAPDETHTDELEKFLVVEGSCDIIIGEKTHSLKSGDFKAIPLFINHRVEVTSKIPCKIILERAAA